MHSGLVPNDMDINGIGGAVRIEKPTLRTSSSVFPNARASG